MDDLTPKQRAFTIAYRRTGVGVESAREAGYEGNYNTLNSVARENLQKPAIIAALRALADADLPKIASANEVLEILSTIARGHVLADAQRVKACELLGKRYRLFDEVSPDVTSKITRLKWGYSNDPTP